MIMTDDKEMYEIFDEEEFNNLTEAEKRSKAQSIQQLFIQRRSNYHQIRNQTLDLQAHKTISEAIIDFDTKFSAWNNQTQQTVRQNNINQIVSQFQSGNELFRPMEELYHNFLIEGIPYGFGIKDFVSNIEEKFSRKYEDMLEHSRKTQAALKEELLNKISEGIDDVLNLKNELKITGTFKERIEKQLTDSPQKAKTYFGWFIASVVLLCILLVGSFFIPSLKSLEWYASLALRASVALPIFWISQTLYNNYKYYRVAEMKYDHLDRLLGGGASEITRMIDDHEAKALAYHRLSELFLDIQDLTGIVSSDKHPTQKSLNEATEMIKQVKAITKDFSYNKKKGPDILND